MPTYASLVAQSTVYRRLFLTLRPFSSTVAAQQTGHEASLLSVSAGSFRQTPNRALALPMAKTTKHDQVVKGSYPVPPEYEHWWGNKRICHGGAVEQTVSPYQMKVLWPYAKLYPARIYSILADWVWDWSFAWVFAWLIFLNMHYQNERYLRNKYWY
eukprot:Selendium_serpulae@DN2333_c0_g1_i1.p2